MLQLLDAQINKVKADPQSLTDYPHPTVYHELLKDAAHVPPHRVLRDEAVLFVTAGTDTASDALTVGTLHVLSDPAVHARVLAELCAAWPVLEDVPRFEVLEKLPYLVRPARRVVFRW